MVESDAALYPAMLIEHVGVESGVHSFAGTTGAERPASAEKGLEGRQGVDVFGGYREGFECKMDM